MKARRARMCLGWARDRPRAVPSPWVHSRVRLERDRPLDPVNPPEQVADAIVSVAKRPRREVLVGQGGRMMTSHHALAPGMYETTAARQVDRALDSPASTQWFRTPAAGRA
jgi:hypothetical protein